MNSSDELKIYGNPEVWSKHKIVCLHPLADQKDLLNDLDMTPNDCVICDVYWDYKGHLFFASFIEYSKPGIDLRKKPDVEHQYTFIIRTEKIPFKKDMIEKGIDFLESWIEAQNIDLLKGFNSTLSVLEKDLFFS